VAREGRDDRGGDRAALRRPPRALARLGVAASLFLLPAGCGLPRDAEGTLDRVRREGVLRAGASHHPPYVVAQDGRPTGPEPARVEAFARRHGARVEWRVAAQTRLADLLREGEIDVAVSGFLDGSPFSKEVAFTRPWDPGGHVIAARPGENALLLALDRFLASEESRTLDGGAP
jgi:ABC-type amino acid transport substrate-binding protein